MSIQSRAFSAPQLNPGNFVQPAPPGVLNLQQNSSSSSLNFMSASSSSIFHRNPPRDPFTLSAPPSNVLATLPGSAGLFLSPSVNSHSGFVPTRIGANKAEAPMMKPPKPPEKPLMPYMRYSRRMWEKVRTSNPDSKLWDIGKIIGQMWRELPESSRQVYVDEYEYEKQEYDRSLKAYHNSPAYQAYLISKNRTGRPGEKSSSGTSESGVYIQPVDEDEGDAGQFSLKQLASSRYHRNHRLMKEIFGETQVPDARNVITSQRLGVLKKQVNSLTLHQNKLEEELKQLESRFESKKRKLDETSTQFTSALKKICSQKIDPFEVLVEKSKTHLLNAYEQYKVQEQKQREALLNESSQPPEAQPASTSDQQLPSSSNDTEEAGPNSEAELDQTEPNQDTAPDELASKADADGENPVQDGTTALPESPTPTDKAVPTTDETEIAEDGRTDDQPSGDSLEEEDEVSETTAMKEGEKTEEKEDGKEIGDTPLVDDSSENSQEA